MLSQVGMNLVIGVKAVLTEPANPGDHIITIGGVGRRDALTLGRQQAKSVTGTLGMGAQLFSLLDSVV